MKKNIVRIVALLLAAMMLLGTLATAGIFANSYSVDEGVYAFGIGLNESQKEETKKLLGIDQNVQTVEITAADGEKYLGMQTNDSAMISSIYVETNDDTAVRVDVTTPLTIQKVTSVQYTNAAITAGLNNVDIRVASPVAVTGESALTGVYKVMEVTGQALDPERTKTANEEIQVINVIADEHEDDENFSKDKLNKVVIEVKQELIERKEENGNITAEEIGTVIQNVVKDNDLDQVITNNNIESLQVYFQNFINIENLNIDIIKDQLENLSKDAPEIAEREVNRIKEFFETEEGKKLLESVSGKFSQENIDDFLSNAKSSLDSPEIDNLLNNIKEGVNSENIDSVLQGAQDTINERVDSGLLQSISDFFTRLFNGIGNFFRNILG